MQRSRYYLRMSDGSFEDLLIPVESCDVTDPTHIAVRLKPKAPKQREDEEFCHNPLCTLRVLCDSVVSIAQRLSPQRYRGLRVTIFASKNSQSGATR